MDWLHLAGPRYLRSEDDSFFPPLDDLEPGDARVFLGIVLPVDGVPGLRRRQRTASRYLAGLRRRHVLRLRPPAGQGRHGDDARAPAGRPGRTRVTPEGAQPLPARSSALTERVPQLGMRPTPAATLNPALDDATLVQILIETPAGVANADEIAAVDGVDMLAFGANDFTAELGVPGQYGDPRVTGAIAALAEACQRHGKLAHGRRHPRSGHARRPGAARGLPA